MKKTISSAADNSSADTGNKGEENVEESIEKAVQVDTTKILVEDKSLQTEKLTLPQEIHSKSLYSMIKKDKKLFNFYTTFPNHSIFLWVYSLVSGRELFVCSKLASKEEHLLLVLIKLKQGFLNADLAFRFSIRHSDVSRIYNSWIIELSNVLKFLIIWPECDALRNNLSNSFLKYKNCTAIIDCTEIYIERPLNLQACAQTWYNYKNTNTIKYLIAITPAGAVNFLSRGWGGCVSDKEITMHSVFLKFLQHGDLILADRGFNITETLATHGAILKIPHFTKGKLMMIKRLGRGKKCTL